MIKENELKEIIARENELLKVAVGNMETLQMNNPRTKMLTAWEREADRLAARIAAFKLVLSGVRQDDGELM